MLEPGGRGSPCRFQVTGMIEWGQKSKPKKIRRASNKDQNLTPKKSHAKFPSDKNFSSFVELCGWAHTGTTTNLQIVLNTPKNPYLNQATPPKNTLFC